MLPPNLEVFAWLDKSDGVEVTQDDLISYYNEWTTKNFVAIYVCFSVIGGYIGAIPCSLDEIKSWAELGTERIFEWYLVKKSYLSNDSGLTPELIESIHYE